MYCKFCGKSIPEKSQFCRFCGSQQYNLEKSKPKKEEGYFLSHWKFIFAFLRPALGYSLLYGLFIAAAFFVLEIVASFFGYCITTRGQKCSESGEEILYVPVAFGGLYFMYGLFSVIKRALILISQSFELKLILGLLDRPRNIKEYLIQRGLNTLFLPKYLLLITLVLVLLLFFSRNFTLILFCTAIFVLVTDLRFIRWLFIKLLKLDKCRLDNIND